MPLLSNLYLIHSFIHLFNKHMLYDWLLCQKLLAAHPMYSFCVLVQTRLPPLYMASVLTGSSLLLSISFTSSSSAVQHLSIAVINRYWVLFFSPYSFSSDDVFSSPGLCTIINNISDLQIYIPDSPPNSVHVYPTAYVPSPASSQYVYHNMA